MNILDKVYERITMIVIFFLVSTIIFTLLSSNMVDQRAEIITNSFVMTTMADGVLTAEEYKIFLQEVSNLQQGYEVELEHQTYTDVPYYEFTTASAIADYFSQRNVLKSKYLEVESIIYEDIDPASVVLQTMTNDNVIQSLAIGGYLPLPDDGIVGSAPVYEAVLPVQECYEGEQLVTVVRVQDNGMVYYMECDDFVMAGVGTGLVPLEYNGTSVGTSVLTTVYPRTRMCAEGHETTVTPEMIALYKSSGDYGACPLCSYTPISIAATDVNTLVGTEWVDLPTVITVTYQNGDTEVIEKDDPELYYDFDSNYCGVQNVTLSYRGLQQQCMLVTLRERSCVACGALCSQRSYTDYERFNYCETCLAAKPFYMGEIYNLTDIKLHEDIISTLETTGEYKFMRGDYIKVTLTRVGRGLPIPFVNKETIVPIITSGYIRTTGQ